MLTGAEDYVCVDTTGFSSSVVTGDIMPVRDNRGDGSWRAMKYEDLLFLQEALWQRRRWEGGSAQKVNPAGRDLDLMKFAGMCIDSSTNLSRSGATSARPYIDVDYPLESWVGTASIDAYIEPARSIGFASIDRWRPPNRSDRFDAELPRRAYYNLGLAKRTVGAIGGAALFSHVREDIWSSPDGEVIRHTDSEYDVEGSGGVSDIYRFSGTSISGNYLHKYEITVRPTVGVAYPWVVSAKLLMRIDTHRVNPFTDWSDVVVFDCTVADHVITPPSIDTWAIAETACLRHGVPFHGTYEYTLDTTEHGAVSLGEIALVCLHDFPAEVDSLNWDWQPDVEAEA